MSRAFEAVMVADKGQNNIMISLTQYHNIIAIDLHMETMKAPGRQLVAIYIADKDIIALAMFQLQSYLTRLIVR